MATRLSVSQSFVSLDGRITVEDWAKLPETKPHYELIDGILKQKPMKTFAQVHAASRLAIALHCQMEAQGWQFFTSGTGLKTDDFNGFVPDVVGFTPETILEPDAVYETEAFLVAEVASPWVPEELGEKKRRDYERAGVPFFVWIDAEQRTFEIYRLEDNKYGAPEILKENEVWEPAELPGLRLELAKLWM